MTCSQGIRIRSFQLRNHFLNILYFSDSAQESGFFLSLNNVLDAPIIGTTASKIRIGYETNILIKAVQLVANDGVRGYEIEDRKCRFSDEPPENSLFNFYSQKLCRFQCK